MKEHKIYSDTIEGAALSQFYDAMKQPFVVKGALMPDAHMGYSLPIGAVVATKDYIIPSWVGYDIGCGMCAISTTFKKEDIQKFSKEIFDEVYRTVPVGFKKNDNSAEFPEYVHLTTTGRAIYDKRGGAYQQGTLGGGNHFIEIGADSDDVVWIVIHSGSRGVGHGIAQHYMKLASPTGKASEGHFGFETWSPNGMDYINDMNRALEFALLNRKTMIERVRKAIVTTIGYESKATVFINRNHNHAELKDGLWIHRKGATHADSGMMGVIPGNMRDGSFIVRGLGNPDALYSSSHGAGRVLGRKAAKEQLNLEDFQDQMKDVTALVTQGTLDESPSAYKDIFEVMELQKDLVEVIAHVKPLINIKG